MALCKDRYLVKVFNPKTVDLFRSIPKHGDSLYHNNIVSTFKIHFCALHIGQVLKLGGTVNPDVLHNAFLQITLTVPQVVNTENGVTSKLPF